MDGIKDTLNKSLGQHLTCAVFYGLLVLLLTVNLSSHLHYSGRGDWDQFYFYDEVPQITIFHYHQFPLWNPYSCGGMPMLANPQSRFFSPALIFSAIFGVIVGLKIELIFGLFFGMMGMYLLGRFLKMSWPAVLLPGVIFGLNGALCLHLTEGPSLLPVVYFPYVFLFFLRSFEDIRYVMFSSFFMALSFLQGDMYGFVFFMVFLAFFIVIRSFQARSYRPLLSGLAFFMAVSFWSAPKLLPMLELGEHHSRLTSVGGYIPLRVMGDIFLSSHQGMFATGINEFSNNIGCWELGAYLGIGVLIIYLFGFFYAFDQCPILFAGVLCFVFSLGNFAPFSLWNLFHKIPPFSNMHVPTRMFLVFIFSVSMVCGFALDRFFKNFPRKNIIVSVIILLIAVNLLWVGRSIFSGAIGGQMIEGKDQVSLFQSAVAPAKLFKQTYVPPKEWARYGAWSTLEDSVLNNEGVVNAYEMLPVQSKAIPNSSKDYKGEYYLTNRGSAKMLNWSPNEIGLLVDTPADNKLVINQNYDKNWRALEGLKVQSFKGLLAVDLKRGQHQVTLSYMPISFLIGCVFFLIAFLTTVFIVAKRKVCDIL